jgi:hypothetical protein
MNVIALFIVGPLSGLLRPSSKRAGSNTAYKCDEFPSPHGFARAEDYIAY